MVAVQEAMPDAVSRQRNCSGVVLLSGTCVPGESNLQPVGTSVSTDTTSLAS